MLLNPIPFMEVVEKTKLITRPKSLLVTFSESQIIHGQHPGIAFGSCEIGPLIFEGDPRTNKDLR